MAKGTVHVKGFREFQRANKEAEKNVDKAAQEALKAVGEPVRQDAERYLVSEVTGVTGPWSQYRIGGRASIYVAPKKRRSRTGSRRPNFALLLLKPMLEAVQANERRVVTALEKAMSEIARDWGRGG